MSPRIPGLLCSFPLRHNVPFLTSTLRGQRAAVSASTSHFHTSRALAEDRTPPSSSPSSLPHTRSSSESEGLKMSLKGNAPLVDRSRILNNLSESLNRLVPQRTPAAATENAPGRSTGPGQQPRAFGRPQGAAPQGALATQEGAGAFEVTPEDMKVYEQKFGQGTVYAPNDLSMEAYMAGKKNKQQVGRRDPFKLLGIDPRMEYKNYNLLAEFTTSMGRIKHSKETGLSPVNQRRIAKAVRRAVGLGLLPSTHYHPEILKEKQLADLQRVRFR